MWEWLLITKVIRPFLFFIYIKHKKFYFLVSFVSHLNLFDILGTTTRVKCFYLYLEEDWCINSVPTLQAGGMGLVSIKKNNKYLLSVQSYFNWQILMAIRQMFSISTSAYRPYWNWTEIAHFHHVLFLHLSVLCSTHVVREQNCYLKFL